MNRITPAYAALLLAAISGGALLAALVAQYGFHLAPCELCIYQRVPYAVIVALGLLAWFGPARFAKPILYILTALLATECAIAVFHVGVEHKWWEGTSSCKINFTEGDLQDFANRIKNAPRALCGDVAWSLFGISMAGYNALMSFGLFAASGFYLCRHFRENGNSA